MPGDVEDVEVTAGPGRVGPGEGVERREVDRPRALAAAEDEQAARAGGDPEALPGRVAVGGEDRRGHRPPGDDEALALHARDRERQADPARAPREQPVGEAEVAVGLGQHERQSQRERREAPRARDVAAAAEDGVGAPRAQHLARRGHGRWPPARAHRPPSAGCERSRPRTSSSSTSYPAAGTSSASRRPRAPRKKTLGALSPKRVGDGQRRHHVPGCSPRGYRDPWHGCSSSSSGWRRGPRPPVRRRPSVCHRRWRPGAPPASSATRRGASGPASAAPWSRPRRRRCSAAARPRPASPAGSSCRRRRRAAARR